MKLVELEGKKVRIMANNKKVYEGIVGDYIYPEDNEPEGEEGIIIDNPKYSHPIQFNAHEIKSIEIIK